jgi:hypothetical protein
VSTLAGQLTKSYNAGLLSLSIGGIPLAGGAAEDGVVTFENNSDTMELTVGATGLPTFSLLNDDVIIATITLMETSVAYAALGALLNAQNLAVSTTGVIPPTPFSLFDVSTGDTMAAGFAVFMSRPNMNKGRVAGPREFVVALPGAGALSQYGLANLL